MKIILSFSYLRFKIRKTALLLMIVIGLIDTAAAQPTNGTIVKKSKPFKINGIEMYWKYSFTRHHGMTEGFLELQEKSSQRILMHDENLYWYDEHLDEKGFNDKFRDANFDGLLDLVIFDKTGSGQGGDVYNIYVFDKEKRRFELSELTGEEINPEKRTVTSFWKSGLGYQLAQIQHVGNDGKIAFTERHIREIIEDDKVQVKIQKIIGGKIVEENTTVQPE